MEPSQSSLPRPLHGAWVVLISFVTTVCGVVFTTNHNSARLWEGTGIGLFLGVATWALYGPFWLGLVWGIFAWSKRMRWRTAVMLLPSLAMVCESSWLLVTDPPSPEKYFAAWFRAPLPARSKNIKVRPPTLVDSGYVSFYFHCSKAETQALIKAMNVTLDPADSSSGGIYPPDSPSPETWQGRQSYSRIDGKTGTGYFIVTDGPMEQVMVSRNPGWSKTDEEAGITR